MPSTFHLVKMAVGNADITPSIARLISEASAFDLFDVELPRTQFSGIPLNWVFVVLDVERAAAAKRSAASLLDDAREVISKIPRDKLAIIISNDPKVHLADEFGRLNRDIFCLDYAELPQSKGSTQPRLAPFILAIQRSVSINPILARAFSPYQRNKPASGWRFFGREKQLRDIIDGTENLVVVGARRVGKTSLLVEAERRLREDGKEVFYVDVQECKTANEVVAEVLRVVSPREAARAFKHHEAFQESVFSNILRRMALASGKTVLILDELGNVLSRLPKEDWSFLGLLRKWGAKPGLRFIISCFQEMYFRQQTDFEGPLINFANTMRLEVFTRKEVEEFVVAPLDFWKPLGPVRNDLLNAVISSVGSHPYFLQFFCHALFDRFTLDRAFDPMKQANTLLKKDLHEWFPTAVDEIFFRIPSAALRYLFLRRCYEADSAGQPVNQAEFADEWIDTALSDLSYTSTTRGRRNLLDGLEMHGLCVAVDYDRAKRVVAAPLVYSFIKRTTTNFDIWLAKLGQEIERERVVWDLNRVPLVV
jgi:hypothetical protein